MLETIISTTSNSYLQSSRTTNSHSLKLMTISQTAVCDVKTLIKTSWNCHFRGHWIITPKQKLVANAPVTPPTSIFEWFQILPIRLIVFKSCKKFFFQKWPKLQKVTSSRPTWGAGQKKRIVLNASKIWKETWNKRQYSKNKSHLMPPLKKCS